MMSKVKGVIVAGNSLQYHQYLHQYGLSPHEFPLVMSIEKLRGYRDIPALSVGTYYQLKDFSDMRDYVMSHGMNGGLESLGIRETDK